MPDRGLDEPEPDAAEQHQEAVPGADRDRRLRVPLEADAADAAEQARVVELGDEDYR